jgi:hypothetical protein
MSSALAGEFLGFFTFSGAEAPACRQGVSAVSFLLCSPARVLKALRPRPQRTVSGALGPGHLTSRRVAGGQRRQRTLAHVTRRVHCGGAPPRTCWCTRARASVLPGCSHAATRGSVVVAGELQAPGFSHGGHDRVCPRTRPRRLQPSRLHHRRLRLECVSQRTRASSPPHTSLTPKHVVIRVARV